MPTIQTPVKRHPIKLAKPAKGRGKGTPEKAPHRAASARRPALTESPSQPTFARLSMTDLAMIASMIKASGTGLLNRGDNDNGVARPCEQQATEGTLRESQKPEAPRCSPIQQALEDLYSAQSTGGKLLRTLTDKLDPVLGSPIQQAVATSGIPPRPGSSGIMHQIMEYVQRQQFHNEMLQDLLHRTELPEPKNDPGAACTGNAAQSIRS